MKHRNLPFKYLKTNYPKVFGINNKFSEIDFFSNNLISLTRVKKKNRLLQVCIFSHDFSKGFHSRRGSHFKYMKIF